MSKVKINNAQYDELKNHTKSAYTAFEEAEKLWGDAKRWNMDDRWDDTQRWNDSGYWNEGQRWNDDGRWE